MVISIVIPVYNGALTVNALVERLIAELEQTQLQIVLINDGSSDESDKVCCSLIEQYPGIVSYLNLSKNFGEHNAVMAGLNYAIGDYAIIMDDDFQNPPEEVLKLVDCMIANNYDVLYTYYDKKQHSPFRNLGSWFNDKASNVILKKPKSLYLSSFKCINRFIINEIIKYKGPFPYIDGLILRATRNIGTIKVRHDSSLKSKSGYTLGKLLSLWLNMFINFSIVPLRISFFLGSVLTVFGLLLIVFFTLDFFFLHPKGPWPAGWASLIICVIIFSGTQLVSLGLLGEYMGKMYLTTNNTPQFVVRSHHGVKEEWASR